MSHSLSAEQIAEVQAQLGPNQALYPDGTIRDTLTGHVVATIAFENAASPSQQQTVELPHDAQQDAAGNIYSSDGEMIFQMTEHGLVPVEPPEHHAVAAHSSNSTYELPPGAQQDAAGNIYDASGLMLLQMTAQGLVPIGLPAAPSSSSSPSLLSSPPSLPTHVPAEQSLHYAPAAPASSLPASLQQPGALLPPPVSDVASVIAEPTAAKPKPPAPPAPVVRARSTSQSISLPSKSFAQPPPPSTPPPVSSSAAPPTIASSNALRPPGPAARSDRSPQASPRGTPDSAMQLASPTASAAGLTSAVNSPSAASAGASASAGAGVVFLSAADMPLVPLDLLHGCTLESDGRLLSASGQLTGWVQPDGVLIAPTGMALGRMPDKAALEMWEQGARMLAAQEAAAVAAAQREAAALRNAVPDWSTSRMRVATELMRADLLHLPHMALLEGADGAAGDEQLELELEAVDSDEHKADGATAGPRLSRSLSLRRSNSVLEARSDPVQEIVVNEIDDDEEKAVAAAAADGDEFANDGMPLDPDFEARIAELRSTLPYESDFIPFRFQRRAPRSMESVPMHERFAQAEVFMEVFIFKRLSINADQFTFVMLDGLDGLLDKRQIKTIGPLLSLMRQTETLIIRQAGLKKIDGLRLPQLVMLDLSYNKITEVDSLESTLCQCSGIQQLNLRDNPICAGSDWTDQIPSHKAKVWKALVQVPTLEVLNGLVLPNPLRAQALERASPKALRLRIPDLLFNIAVNQSDNVLEMESWQPFRLEHLNLSDQFLSRAHVGSFKALVELNLSHNRLQTLQGIGLEQCVRLRRLSVTHNALSKAGDFAALQPLSFLPALRDLWLSDNEALGSRYADAAIALTRNAHGTRHAPGLQSLDGRQLTIDDRVKALLARGMSPSGAEAERWRLTLVASFGHARVSKGVEFFERARRAELCGSGISGRVDVSLFKSLIKLNLERNRLREVHGLESLICLRVCLLAGNAELDVKRVLNQLSQHSGLEHISLRPKPEKERVDATFLKRVFVALSSADRLAVVDGVMLTPADRMDIVSQTVKFSSPIELCAYSVNLALLIASSPVQGRDYNTKNVLQRRGVVETAARHLYGLANLHLKLVDLKSVACDFRVFRNLERLDLSGNSFDDLSALGLHELPALWWLDMRDNGIATELQALAAQIDALSALKVLAIRGNPCIRSDSSKHERADRLTLMGHMQRLRAVDCSLRVLDTEITVNERVAAWQAGGLSADEAEHLRAQIALHVRTPAGALSRPSTVLTLDLSALELRIVLVSPFAKLQRLSLRGNKLASLAGLGIQSCVQLVALDLRDNLLSSCSEIFDVCSGLEQLRVLACCSGNTALGDAAAARRAVIAEFQTLRDPSCALRFLDEKAITVAEICEAFLERAPSNLERFGGRREACEALRFQLTMWRRIQDDRAPPSGGIQVQPWPQSLEVEALDLGNANLESVHGIASLARLRRLNLDQNRLTSSLLQKGELTSLRYLEVLSLRHNQFANIRTIAAILDALPALRIVHLAGNRAFGDGGVAERIELLQHMSRNAMPKFSLVSIDGQPVTVSERIAALKAAGAADDATLESFRLQLSLERMHADPETAISLDLKRAGLTNIRPVAAFTRLETLSLQDNCLRTLVGQGLEQLVSLRELDVRRNSFESLSDAVVDPLTACHSLQVLWLAGAVKGHTDGAVETYAVEVCERLRGLTILDGLKNPRPLKAVQRDAQEFLWQLARIGPNQLHSINVADQQIPASFFFYFLAALAEIRLTSTLVANNNPWHTGITRVPNYRAYIIYTLGEHLQSLDGEAVITDELRNALQQIEKEQEDGKSQLIKGGWRACRERAHLEARQFRLKRTAALGAKQRRRASIAAMAAPLVVGRPGATATQGGIGADQIALGVGDVGGGAVVRTIGGGGDEEEINDDKLINDDDDLMDEDEAKREADDGPGFWDTGGGANDAELSGKIDQVWSTMASITGSILTKAEIIISFFQVYALYLVIDLKIPWPAIWLWFSKFVYFFSFKIDILFDFEIPYKQEIIFGFLVCIPLMFFLFYMAVDRMKSDKWIERYSNNWVYTRRRAAFIWFALVVASFFGAMFYDYPMSYNLLFSGKLPAARTNGVIVVCWGVVTFFALVWLLVVRNFRSNYVGVDHHEFLKWWLERTFILRKAMLFFLTICFMPASRIVLAQFACINGTLVELPGQACFPTRVSAIQVIAFVFGVLYILGIPIFFYRLISQGTNIVCKAGFETRGAELLAEIERLKAQREKFKDAAWKAKEYDDAIEEYENYLKTLWANEVVKNPLPQTYLYAAYEQKWRYYKIFQMAQKLAVLVITNFVPAENINSLKVWCGTVLQGGFAFAALFFRPFSDGAENIMDVVSQVANFVNVFAALGITLTFMSQYTATISLFVVNIASMATMALNLFATPIRACLAQRAMLERAAKVALEAAASEAERAAEYAADAASAVASTAVTTVAAHAPHIEMPAMPELPPLPPLPRMPSVSLPTDVVEQTHALVAKAAHEVVTVGTTLQHGVFVAADATVNMAERVGGAMAGAAASAAHHVVVAAPSIAEAVSEHAREGAAQVAAHADVAQRADSTVAASVHAASAAATAAAHSELVAQGVAAAGNNSVTLAEAAFEHVVASHSTKNDDELTAKFENSDGTAKRPAERLLRK